MTQAHNLDIWMVAAIGRVAAAGLVFGVGLAILATHSHPSAPAAVAALSPGPPSITTPITSKQEALDTVSRDKTFEHIDRVEAKLVTLATLIQSDAEVHSMGIDNDKSISVTRQVWVIAVSGRYRPQFAMTPQTPQTFPWAMVVIGNGPDSPAIDATIAESVGTWPPSFDALVDLAPTAASRSAHRSSGSSSTSPLQYIPAGMSRQIRAPHNKP
jgi:hypothetical protein